VKPIKSNDTKVRNTELKHSTVKIHNVKQN